MWDHFSFMKITATDFIENTRFTSADASSTSEANSQPLLSSYCTFHFPKPFVENNTVLFQPNRIRYMYRRKRVIASQIFPGIRKPLSSGNSELISHPNVCSRSQEPSPGSLALFRSVSSQILHTHSSTETPLPTHVFPPLQQRISTELKHFSAISTRLRRGTTTRMSCSLRL